MGDLVIVKWLKKKAPYNIGEICGLEPHVASREVGLGTAELIRSSDKSKIKDHSTDGKKKDGTKASKKSSSKKDSSNTGRTRLK